MRLLIVRLSAMGDVIHALPLAANARAAGATVGWVVERPFAGLLDGNPHCAEVLVADTKAWRRHPFAPGTLRGIANLGRRMRAFSPDVTVDAQGLWKSAVIARAAGAPVAGFAAGARREPSSAALCAIAVTPGPEARHVVDRNLALLPAVGIAVAVSAPDARYLLARPSPEAERFAASRPRPFAVLHPGAGREDKCWGEERFARLASALRERGVDAVVSWGPGDEARAARLEALAPAATRAPRLDLAGLARLADASRLFVAGDTGPLHLADAVGARTLALFGPTDPERNGPYRKSGAVVANMRGVSDEDVIQRAFRALEAGRPLTPGP